MKANIVPFCAKIVLVLFACAISTTGCATPKEKVTKKTPAKIISLEVKRDGYQIITEGSLIINSEGNTQTRFILTRPLDEEYCQNQKQTYSCVVKDKYNIASCNTQEECAQTGYTITLLGKEKKEVAITAQRFLQDTKGIAIIVIVTIQGNDMAYPIPIFANPKEPVMPCKEGLSVDGCAFQTMGFNTTP